VVDGAIATWSLPVPHHEKIDALAFDDRLVKLVLQMSAERNPGREIVDLFQRLGLQLADRAFYGKAERLAKIGIRIRIHCE
jgi:hypothetical protein